MRHLTKLYSLFLCRSGKFSFLPQKEKFHILDTICHPKPSVINKLCNRHQGTHKYEAANLSGSNMRTFIQFSKQVYID